MLSRTIDYAGAIFSDHSPRHRLEEQHLQSLGKSGASLFYTLVGRDVFSGADSQPACVVTESRVVFTNAQMRQLMNRFARDCDMVTCVAEALAVLVCGGMSNQLGMNQTGGGGRHGGRTMRLQYKASAHAQLYQERCGVPNAVAIEWALNQPVRAIAPRDYDLCAWAKEEEAPTVRALLRIGRSFAGKANVAAEEARMQSALAGTAVVGDLPSLFGATSEQVDALATKYGGDRSAIGVEMRERLAQWSAQSGGGGKAAVAAEEARMQSALAGTAVLGDLPGLFYATSEQIEALATKYRGDLSAIGVDMQKRLAQRSATQRGPNHRAGWTAAIDAKLIATVAKTPLTTRGHHDWRVIASVLDIGKSSEQLRQHWKSKSLDPVYTQTEFTTAEKQQLKVLYAADASASAIAKQMRGRSTVQVREQCKRMKLKHQVCTTQVHNVMSVQLDLSYPHAHLSFLLPSPLSMPARL